jgi:hypothetical protein
MKLAMDVTFDTNCLVDLELKEGAVGELSAIIAAHEEEKITISVPGIGASERLKDGTFAKNFSLFQQRINKLTKRQFEILKPPLYLGLAYFNWAILAGDTMIDLERQIHQILFPEIHFIWADHAIAHGLDPNQAVEEHNKEWIKWRNRKCDTLSLWCHIYYNKDVFVTRDKNFHKATKKAALEKLGAKCILLPTEVGL